jgi:hypothetical protein
MTTDVSYASGTGPDSWLAQDVSQAVYQSQVAMTTLREMIEQGADAQAIREQARLAQAMSERANELYKLMHEQHAAIASGKESGYRYNPNLQVRYSRRVY